MVIQSIQINIFHVFKLLSVFNGIPNLPCLQADRQTGRSDSGEPPFNHPIVCQYFTWRFHQGKESNNQGTIVAVLAGDWLMHSGPIFFIVLLFSDFKCKTEAKSLWIWRKQAE